MTLTLPKLKAQPPKPYQAVLGQGATTWKPGVISLIDESRLPVGAVVEAKNLMQVQDGVWGTRWGSKPYGADFTGPVTGAISYVVYHNDGTHTQYVMIMDAGKIKSSSNGGAWTTLSSHTFNTTVHTRFLQYEDKILIANGVDNFCYYDITLATLVTYTPLSTPAAPTATLNNLTSGQYPLYYQITAVSQVGETVGSAVTTVNVNINRNQWYNPNATQVASTSYSVGLSWAQVSGAVAYNIYLSDGVSGVAYYLDSVGQPTSGSVNYTDYGNAAINDFIEVPTIDTTSAPKFSWIGLSANRLWATGDPNNPNRVYWFGTGTYALATSPALGGGWVDILPGGAQRPSWVGQFRDGKGSALTTVLLSEPSGYGSTWHVDLQSDQIGNTTIVVPAVTQALGTFGTLSPYGVVETNENIYFHSGTGGFYSTGSVPTLFNILSTNEVSILIRPDVKALFLSGLANVCGIEYDRKLWWSVPYSAPNNNRIFIYDLEKNNWNPYAFDFGVSEFLRYTDNSGLTHLLAVPLTGNQLIELHENFLGDNNKAFESHLQTGLVHVTPDHVQFAQILKVYYEFGRPNSIINVLFSGTQRNVALSQLLSENLPLGASQSSVGFSSFPFSVRRFSHALAGPIVTTQVSVKKRLLINKLLNNWEMEIITNTLGRWTLNQFIVTGVLIPIADPTSWITD